MKYEFLFEDGSLFVVPVPWRDVYEMYFGAADPAELEARLRFVVGKYMEHRAIPTKFDGIGVTEEGEARYDDPAYYAERWDDPHSRERLDEPPTMATVAKAVLYQAMRVGLLQKMANDYAAEHGTKPIRVLTAEQMLAELGEDPSPQAGR